MLRIGKANAVFDRLTWV